MSDVNGATEPKPEDVELQPGDRLPNGFIYCGCDGETELWPLTNARDGLTVFQCSKCKRNIGWGYAQKRQESPLIIPGKRFN